MICREIMEIIVEQQTRVDSRLSQLFLYIHGSILGIYRLKKTNKSQRQQENASPYKNDQLYLLILSRLDDLQAEDRCLSLV